MRVRREGDIPPILGPQLIGQIIALQIFERDKDAEPGMILHDTLVKYVGTLIGYIVKPNQLLFIFEGANVEVDFETHYCEVYMGGMIPKISSERV